MDSNRPNVQTFTSLHILSKAPAQQGQASGLFAAVQTGDELFLIADACYHLLALDNFLAQLPKGISVNILSDEAHLRGLAPLQEKLKHHSQLHWQNIDSLVDKSLAAKHCITW